MKLSLSILKVMDPMHVMTSQKGICFLHSLFIFQEDGDIRGILEKNSRTAIFKHREKESYRRKLLIPLPWRLVATNKGIYSFML